VPPRPRIVVLITLAAAGGAQTYVMLLVPALVERFDVTVAAWGPGPLRGAVEAVGADYVELRHVRRPLSLWRDLLGLLELVRLLRRVRPQIVHANSSKAGVLGRVAAVVARVPIRIFTVHGWAFAAYSGSVSRVYLWADRLMRPLTTRIVCVAENERRLGLAAGTCTDARTVVIRNAVDVAAAPQAALEGDPPVLVTVGRFSYPKDFVTLVQALARLPAGSFRARVLGDGPDRPPIEAEIARHGLAGAVELTGEVDDVAEQLAEADVFVLSSRSEGLPISVLEAMAAGLPVVASAVGGLPELVEEDETGTLVPAGDADALAAALQRLIEDPERRRRLGRAGRARAEARFDLPRFRDAHLDLYASLLGEGDPAAEPSATVRP
jgi:glycosyltransferase involved in cell wall biosynthesis